MKDTGGYSVTDYYIFALTFMVGFITGLIVAKEII